MTSRVSVASILHGAYGDYYEQAICLKHFKLTHPDLQLKLFAASPHRLEELRVLDFGFAESFELWPEIGRQEIDSFLQFQVRSPDLAREVLAHLPERAKSKIDLRKNLLPWKHLREMLPLSSKWQMDLSDLGKSRLLEVMTQNGITEDTFRSPTIGFLWRYRTARSHVKPYLQPPAEALIEKYSKVLRRAIETLGCKVLVCGMKVKTTDENRTRVDAKYPEFGLDLPAEHSVHLKGLNWALEMEILSRATVCFGHASGFTEALELRRGGGVMLVDPPPHYLLKLLRHRMPFFGCLQPPEFIRLWFQQSSEDQIFRQLATRLERSCNPLQQARWL